MTDSTQRIAVVDLETTGSHMDQGDQIIQIGAVIIESGQIIGQYSMCLNPEREIPSHISAMTGIRQEDVAGAPTFRQVAGLWFQRLKDCFFVAHNLGFDLTFLQAKFQEEGFDFCPSALDTVQLTKIFLPQAPGFNLQDLSQYFGLDFQDAHDALGDARMTAYLLNVLQERVQALDYRTRITLYPIFKALPYEADYFLDHPKEFACQMDWPIMQHMQEGKTAIKLDKAHQMAAQYWLEQVGGQGCHVLEAPARQGHASLLLALTDCLLERGDSLLWVLENEALMFQWQTLIKRQGIESVGCYRPSYRFLEEKDLYRFYQTFDIKAANQQELTVLAAALIWMEETELACLEELNPEIDIRGMMQRYDSPLSGGAVTGYRHYLKQISYCSLILMTQDDWLALKQLQEGPLSFLTRRRVLVADLAASYQGLVTQAMVTLPLSELFVELKALAERQGSVAPLQRALDLSYQVLEGLGLRLQEAEDNPATGTEWRRQAILEGDDDIGFIRQAMGQLHDALNQWLPQASLSSPLMTYFQEMAATCQLLSQPKTATYLRLQAQMSHGQYYQVSLSRLSLRFKTEDLPQLTAYKQVCFLSDGQYDDPLGHGIFALWNMGANYHKLPEPLGTQPLRLLTPLEYAKLEGGDRQAQQMSDFLAAVTDQTDRQHVLVVAHNRLQAQHYYRLLRDSCLVEDGYLIYSQGQNGSLKKIKRRAEADQRAIVVVPRQLLLDEAFSLEVEDLLVIIDRLPFDSLTADRSQGLAQLWQLPQQEIFETITLPQMRFRLKRLLAQLQLTSPTADFYLLDERIWTRYYSQGLQVALAPGIDVQPFLPS